MTLARDHFPVCRKFAYFLTAGMGPLSSSAFKAVSKQYRKACLSGGAIFRENLDAVENCRMEVARLINARPEQVAFTPNVSFSMNALALSLVEKEQWTVITLREEFPATIIPWKENGYKVVFCEHYDDVIETARQFPHKIVVVVSVVQYSTGHGIDAQDFVRKLRQAAPDCYVVLNATQSVGVLPLDLSNQVIDAVCCTCHKWLMSSEGISFLWLSHRGFELLAPKIVGWKSLVDFMQMKVDGYHIKKDARVFEIGWLNHTSYVAFYESLKLINSLRVERINRSIVGTRAYLITKLVEHKIPILSDLKTSASSGIVLLGPYDAPQQVVEYFRDRRVLVSARGAGIRIAIHFFNSFADIDSLVECLIHFRSERMAADVVE